MDQLDQAHKRVDQISSTQDAKQIILQPMPISELLAKEFPATQWVIEQLIPTQGIVALSGAPSTYKTWLLLQIAQAVASGEPLFDQFPSHQGNVLLIDEENNESLLCQRLKQMQVDKDLPIQCLVLQSFKLTDDSVEQLTALIQSHKFTLIMFDSLVRIHTGDENAARDMAGVYSLFKKITQAGAAVLFTHHNRKQQFSRSPSQDMRGSSDILAGLDCHLAIEKKDGNLTVTQTKLRQAQELGAFQLHVVADETSFIFEYLGMVDSEKSKKDETKDAIMEFLAQSLEPEFKQQIFKGIREQGATVGLSTFKSSMDELEKGGMVYTQRGERNKVFYSLKPFIEPTTEQSVLDE